MFIDTFLSILAVVGIVAISAFVIILLCDLFISIVDGSNGIFFRHNSNKNEKKQNDSSRPKLLKNEEVKVLENAKEERPVVLEEKVEPEKVEEEKEEVSEVEEQRIEEHIVEEKTEQATVVPEENMEAIIAEVSALTKEELEKEEKENALIQANADLARQIEELKAKLEEAKNKEEKEPRKVVTIGSESKEEIEARLEVLRQRLKENDKELSANKKEYIPLRRVNTTLESDKKKLRRKEAIVAKRKVLLYGVNNYVDIDEEKAKELNEELELLEGLRLSVSHCEEVMEKNKDRYPILERANFFLTKNQEDLKADIAELEEKLALIEKKNPQASEEN